MFKRLFQLISGSKEQRGEPAGNLDCLEFADLEPTERQIAKWIISEFHNREGVDLSRDKQALKRVIQAARTAKQEVATKAETTISLPFITADATGPKHLQMLLQTSQLEQLRKE